MIYKVNLYDKQISFEYNNNDELNFIKHIEREFTSDCYSLKLVSFQNGDIVIDCGANIGFFSIILALLYPNIKIYAFEADPENFLKLQKNIEINELQNHTNLKIFNLALSNNNNPLYIQSSYDKNNIGAKYVSTKAHKLSTKIESITLDQIFEKNDIQKVKYLKMDIEGSEYNVLMHCNYLNKVEYFGGEFHYGYFKHKKLYKYLSTNINPKNIFLDYSPIAVIFLPMFHILNKTNLLLIDIPIVNKVWFLFKKLINIIHKSSVNYARNRNK